MQRGFSSQRGIMFGDPALEGDNAVYCWRDQEEIQTLVGPYDQVHKRFRADQETDQVELEEDPRNRLMLKLLVLAIVLIVAAVVLFDGAPVVGAVVFAVIGWFPSYAILATKYHDYETNEMFEQFRRYHGAEHTVVHAQRKSNPSWKTEDLSKLPYLENECGTVHMATLLVWALVAGITIALFPYLGFLKTLGVLFAATVLLLLNLWFNPANPLKLVQKRVVSHPTATELELAACCMQEFIRLEKAAEARSKKADEAISE
ncbi:MAG: DUF1385 domain-containing protein [Eggerthellaceae bacterium]|nr:DUF1385 domain-containing protein [Eggerthellaceae bacterium]